MFTNRGRSCFTSGPPRWLSDRVAKKNDNALDLLTGRHDVALVALHARNTAPHVNSPVDLHCWCGLDRGSHGGALMLRTMALGVILGQHRRQRHGNGDSDDSVRQGHLDTARVLLVDDEPLKLDLLAKWLDHAGIANETAGNGYEALDKYAEEPFDLVWTNWQMPRMDGIELLRAIRDWSKGVVPCILESGSNWSVLCDSAPALADWYQPAPFQRDEALAGIRHGLEVRRAIQWAEREDSSLVQHLGGLE